MSYIKGKVNQSDMRESMQQEVVDVCARIMCTGEATPVQVATEVRKYFDEHHGHSWTCVVGRDFSRWVLTYKNSYFLHSCFVKPVICFTVHSPTRRRNTSPWILVANRFYYLKALKLYIKISAFNKEEKRG